MTNTSATGGYLAPTAPSPPLEGKALLDFIQPIISGISGMAGNLVLPRWQAEPPNIPAAATAFCSFGIIGRTADTFPYISHDSSGDGADNLQRQEQLNILASFYDLGVSGQADNLASLLRDGFAIAQNREVLQLSGYALAYTGDLTPVPSLLKERWLYRVDLPFSIRRQIDRTYPVLNILSAQGTLTGEDGTETITDEFLVEQ